MKTISVLLPTRKRPDNVARLWQSILDTADQPKDIELVIAVDEDDDSYDDQGIGHMIKVPRMVLSQYWNECAKVAEGDILMYAADDILFKTKHWDTLVKAEFDKLPDKIAFVYPHDGSKAWGTHYGTHGFVHRNWFNTLGYICPPYFSGDFSDTWINDVAKKVGRHIHVDVLAEHLHPDLQKAEVDEVYKEKWERMKRDGVAYLYDQKEHERELDAIKLRRVMQ